jgi:polysaccharide deacetylase 2 family uncharacterized protein YibQ
MGNKRGGFVYRARRTSRFPSRTVVALLLAVAALLLVRQHLLRRPAPQSPSTAARSGKTPAAPHGGPAAKPGRSGRAYGPGPETTEPPSRPSGSARAVLVIDDTGGNLDLALDAARLLPQSVTFAVIPYLKDSEASARALHERGFAVILHAPMQPEDGQRWKPVRGEIDVGMAPSQVASALEGSLAEVPFAEGVNNHMGSRATRDGRLMEAVMNVLRARGLYFLDSRTTAGTVAYETARRAGVPCAQRAVFLDDVDKPDAIMAQLDVLGEKAMKEGEAVAIGHLRPNTLRVLSERIPYWERRGLRFVRLREVVR